MSAEDLPPVLEGHGLALQECGDVGLGDADAGQAARGRNRLDCRRFSKARQAPVGDAAAVRPDPSEVIEGGHGFEGLGGNGKVDLHGPPNLTPKTTQFNG